MKFLLADDLACQVESALAPHLVHDPFSVPELGNAYRVTTVYCDTPELDVYHGLGSHKRRKYRLRCYGDESRVYLERKTKRAQQVRKKRTWVAAEDLAGLSQFQPRPDWQGDWFHQQLLKRRSNPVCCLSYLRTAYVGTSEHGPIRLTFDRQLAGAATTAWLPHQADAPIPFLGEQVVCEFKFRGALPVPFKSVIQSLQLTPCGVSKYRHCMQTATATARNGHHA
ncbi:MAG: polyphosphate polymerase domain-containing protein [Planctomycetia bacterium]|nr:polyphosphate polymerase domain-containing protein [Planctomycetia bacterium]